MRWLAVVLAVAVLLPAQEPERTRGIGVMASRRPVRAPLAAEGDGEEYVFGSYHALLIAVQRYGGHEADLRTPANDVTALAEVLEHDYGFAPPIVLRDEQATRAGILGALDELAQRLDENDNLLVYFAGHGTMCWSGSEHEEGYWVPYLPPEAEHRWWNWLSARTLNHATARIPVRHLLLISDSCYSGALLKDRDVRARGALTPDWIRVLHERSSSHILTSGADEPVADDGRDGHSLFAYHLLDALRANAERFLPAATLGDHLVRAVMQDADYDRGRYAQQPVFGGHPLAGSRSGQFGQFLFVRTGDLGAAGLRMAAEPGMPPGYRRPNHVEVEAVDGGFRYWSVEGGERVEMLLVPGGTLRRGAVATDIEPFLVDRFEVTNARFDRWVNAAAAAVGWRPEASELRGETVPVTGISLDEARAFAAWAGSKRLPTADEWQFAAAFDAGAQRLRPWPWGEGPLQPPLPTGRVPPRVGQDPRDRSPFGIEGMAGGVRELCEVDADAAGTLAPRGIVCGGTQVDLRREPAAPSVAAGPEVDAATRREKVVGFRCVKSLIPPYRPR